MKIVIIKYNAGNVQSVLFALERIGIQGVLSDNAEEICSADKVIFPGVGEAGSAMTFLKEKKLDKVICNLTQPTLGICLGLQLMCTKSEEGNTNCLGIFPLEVKKFAPTLKGEITKVPQIGWNNIYDLKANLFNGVKENEYMYFVHGYYAELGIDTVATTNYIVKYSSALQKNNFYGVQFHPEKSSETGQRILKNFLALNP